MYTRCLLIFCTFLFLSSLQAQNGLPQQFDDYSVTMNPDSLEKIVYAQKHRPADYLHGLIALELSRSHFSNKKGTDLETIKTLAEQEKSDLGRAMYYYIIGTRLINNEEESAAKYILTASNIFETRKDTTGILICYYNLLILIDGRSGLAHNDETNNSYYDKIVSIGNAATSVRAKLIVYQTIIVFRKGVKNIDNLDEEVGLFNKMLTIIHENPKYEYKRSMFYNSISGAYYRRKKYKEYLAHILVTYQITKSYSKNQQMFEANNVGDAYLLNNDLDNAKKYYSIALELDKSSHRMDNELRANIYSSLSEIYSQQKKYKKAWQSLFIYDSLMTIVQQNVRKKDLADIQMSYEVKKREVETMRLQVEQRQARKGLIFLSIAFTLSVVVGLFLIHLYRKNNAQKLELERLNDLSNKQNQELAATNNQMQYFTRTLSHDVLGYISNISNFLNMAAAQNKELVVQKTLEKASRNAQHLRNMCDNLIRTSRLKRGLHLKNINLNQITDEIVENFPTHNISIDIQNLPIAFANYEFVKQVFNNLIGNALKYRRPDTTCLIHISAQAIPNDNFVTIEVRDNGIGIDATQLDKIFDEFEKADNTALSSGLGLFICRQIMETMGGKIWASSEKGVGTSFFFTLKKEQKS